MIWGSYSNDPDNTNTGFHIDAIWGCLSASAASEFRAHDRALTKWFFSVPRMYLLVIWSKFVFGIDFVPRFLQKKCFFFVPRFMRENVLFCSNNWFCSKFFCVNKVGTYIFFYLCFNNCFCSKIIAIIESFFIQGMCNVFRGERGGAITPWVIQGGGCPPLVFWNL